MKWRIAAAYANGTSHVASGLPCQDNLGVEVVDTDKGPVLIAVVSDGAGSASRAEAGSLIATNETVKLVREFLRSGGSIREISVELTQVWLAHLKAEVLKEAIVAGISAREFACTWLLAIVGEDTAIFAQIGDGAIVISGEPETWSCVFWPQNGEYANTTNFIVSANSNEVMEFIKLDQCIREVAVFSDGLENLVLKKSDKTAHSPFFESMFSAVRKSDALGVSEPLSIDLQKYLDSEAINDRTDDDKSLILASRVESSDAATHS